MVIAMIAVRMMQVTVHQIIRVVAVRYGFVAAAFAVDMARLVAAAVVLGRTRVGVRGVDRQHMFINMIPVRMMQVAVVQVISMTIMFHRRMAAASAMLMVVIGMRLTGVGRGLIGHGLILLGERTDTECGQAKNIAAENFVNSRAHNEQSRRRAEVYWLG